MHSTTKLATPTDIKRKKCQSIKWRAIANVETLDAMHQYKLEHFRIIQVDGIAMNGCS